MNARELFQAGRLNDAVAAAIEQVKNNPMEAGPRGLLCELLCFTGDWDRADKHLDVLGQQDPKALVALAVIRQVIRAEAARQQLFTDGRLPEFLDKPTDELQARLQATIAIREQKLDEAAKLLADAEALRRPLKGVCDGQAFDDWRDLDDVTSSVFEVLTTNGKYYWVPASSVESLEFHAPERPRDLIWRRCHMIVRGGPDGEVYVPTLYPRTFASSDDQLRLGRGTEWTPDETPPIRGAGQRMFLVGDEAKAIMQVTQVEFASE